MVENENQPLPIQREGTISFGGGRVAKNSFDSRGRSSCSGDQTPRVTIRLRTAGVERRVYDLDPRVIISFDSLQNPTYTLVCLLFEIPKALRTKSVYFSRVSPIFAQIREFLYPSYKFESFSKLRMFFKTFEAVFLKRGVYFRKFPFINWQVKKITFATSKVKKKLTIDILSLGIYLNSFPGSGPETES